MMHGGHPSVVETQTQGPMKVPGVALPTHLQNRNLPRGTRWEDFTQCHRTWGNQTWKEDSYKRWKTWFLVLATRSAMESTCVRHFLWQIFMDASYGGRPNQPTHSSILVLKPMGIPHSLRANQSSPSWVTSSRRKSNNWTPCHHVCAKITRGVVQTWDPKIYNVAPPSYKLVYKPH